MSPASVQTNIELDSKIFLVNKWCTNIGLITAIKRSTDKSTLKFLINKEIKIN